MEYSISQHEAERTVSVQGSLSFRDMKNFRDLKDTLFSSENSQYIFNLSDVNFIDSAGMGMLLIAYKHARDQNADFMIKTENERVRSILTSTGLMELFATH